ncbi:NfeD family protein [bacterium]|nr:NfeD family protein [bacterium]
MQRKKPDKHTTLRYIAMQIPGTLLALFGVYLLMYYTPWPSWIIWTGFGIWILKDILLFFRVWPSYCPPEKEPDPMVGQRGFVIKPCKPEGSVEIHGTPWQAVIEDRKKSLPTGTRIVVQKREGLTLHVRSE